MVHTIVALEEPSNECLRSLDGGNVWFFHDRLKNFLNMFGILTAAVFDGMVLEFNFLLSVVTFTTIQ
jgi:hypothetical protein